MKPIVFMGSPDFAVPILMNLAAHFDVVGVVTQPDRPAGRGRNLAACPVKKAAVELKIPVIQPEKLFRNNDAIQQIMVWQPDLIIVAAYGKILRKEILDLPLDGCWNVHASLLPRWRGASPIQAAILHGDQRSGITIMHMDDGLDTGAILSQDSLEILPTDTAGSLENRLSEMGSNLLVETISKHSEGKIFKSPQSLEGQTYAPLLKKQDGKLDFLKPVEELERQTRAYNPWPGCFTIVDGEHFKIHTTKIVRSEDVVPGDMYVIDEYPAIGAKNGFLILTEVQPPGKKKMEGKLFLLGYRNWDHSVEM